MFAKLEPDSSRCQRCFRQRVDIQVIPGVGEKAESRTSLVYCSDQARDAFRRGILFQECPSDLLPRDYIGEPILKVLLRIRETIIPLEPWTTAMPEAPLMTLGEVRDKVRMRLT